ncbi:hypothetical protein PUNSTDRAFT_111149 [Punctularia strigosozonata HHB-11173 SS5]|uniref:uncharacterized protein n=1 Tax=Punctularia strigosozonata (strain HHB-11173) TaxID=741275 RepID=UPI0004418580|nr:uncharacterized protein PUNSTDRAFT_111149 [Punctularia strigosozonata HHB-11173 SS5]EIN12757.1 hypothetical protein PUNSTDRAFT_111149 [Punctularia strigosozonata HHB-11173 SS5]
MTPSRSGLLCFLAGAAALIAADPLKIVNGYSGNAFFDGFHFNASVDDPWNYGNIVYCATAKDPSNPLAYVNSAGNVVVKVDNKTQNNGDPFFGRNTVMMMSDSTIGIGTLVVVDAVHIPYGCSIWPAFWTLSDAGDVGGEIDIIETVNLLPANQYTLHTNNGCTLSASSDLPHSGHTTQTNCFFNTTGNPGCSITETASSTSVGAAFAKNGGGVYAMYMSTNGIEMWFFPRGQVPTDLSTNNPEPTLWGQPSASFPASTCNPSTFFQPQRLILNTDLCGSWAGNVMDSTGCPGIVCTTLIADASNFDTAYWEISSVKTFTENGSATHSVIGSSPPEGTSSTNASSRVRYSLKLLTMVLTMTVAMSV